jgi:hypothetical protein
MQHLTQGEARARISRAFASKHPYSLGRALHSMYTDGVLKPGSREHDEAQRLAEEAGFEYDPHAVRVHWEALGVSTRDWTSQTGGAGYSIGTEQQAVALSPNGYSLAADSGATIVQLPRGTGNISIPRVAARPDVYWQSGEDGQLGESSPALGSSVASLKSVSFLVDGTRLLRIQAPEVFDKVLAPEASAALWLAIDKSIVSGSGASGQPTGLALTPGVGIETGAGITWATLLNLKKGATTGGSRSVSWWAGPGAEAALRGKERFSGAGSIWADNGIGGMPSYATAAVEDTTLVCGDFTRLTVFVWGTPRLEVNPFSDFTRGMWSARFTVDCDFVCLSPGSFAIAEGVS